MSMYVDTKYQNFLATVTVKSDSIDAIDLYNPSFRIDFTNQFDAAANAIKIAELIDERTGYEKLHAEEIAEIESELKKTRDDLRYAEGSEESERLQAACKTLTVQLNSVTRDIWRCEHGKYNDCETCSGTGFVGDEICETCKGKCLNMSEKLNNGIEDYLNVTNTPMLSISNDSDVKPDVYCNADDETLIRNGMQYWINEDKKSMTFRFIPQLKVISDTQIASTDSQSGSSETITTEPNPMPFQSVVCVVAFDYNNVVRFEVSLIPRLISGDIEKQDPLEPDPILGQGTWNTSAYNTQTKETDIIAHPLPNSVCDPDRLEIVPDADKIHPDLVKSDVGEIPRTDYEWNSSIDRDHLYINNTDGTIPEQKVPLYICKSSAYISQALMDEGYKFDWSKFKSDLYDVAAGSAVEIPYTINGGTDLKSLEPVTASAVLVETYQGEDPELLELNKTEFNMYEVVQMLETSSTMPIVSKNQLRCRVAI